MKRQKYRTIIRQEGVFFYKALLDSRVPLRAKGVLILAGIYVIYPIDIIPGWIVGLGLIDDIIVITLAIKFVKSKLPHVLVQDLIGKIQSGK